MLTMKLCPKLIVISLQTNSEIAMTNANFTIILDLKIADTDAGYILQWENYYFKFAIYQLDSQLLQFIWIDKGRQ